MIKRSVGLFSGFAIMFVGSAVFFYVAKTKTDIALKSESISLNLVTASPGILAMIIGGIIIMFSIWSKDTFSPLPLQQRIETNINEEKPNLPQDNSNVDASITNQSNSNSKKKEK